MPEQNEMPLRVKREVILLDEPSIARIQSEHAAFRLTVSQSGLQDSQVASGLEIDTGQFSRIMNATAHFPFRLGELYDICGSEAHLQYLNYSRGYEAIPRRRKSELETLLDETRAELENERMKNQILAEAIRGAR